MYKNNKTRSLWNRKDEFFMKQTIIILLIIVGTYTLIGNAFAQDFKIPDEAIRVRIIPNSNSEEDQSIKQKVKELVEENMYELLKDSKSIEEARQIITSNMNLLDKKITNLLIDENYTLGFELDFGYHYFPEKNYQGVTYEEGYYESVLVTIGAGEGDNWWCVLFPPLCMLETEENTEVEYTSLVKEMIEKYF